MYIVYVSVVRYRRYLSKYRDTKCVDNTVTEVTVYCGAVILLSIVRWRYCAFLLFAMTAHCNEEIRF